MCLPVRSGKYTSHTSACTHLQLRHLREQNIVPSVRSSSMVHHRHAFAHASRRDTQSSPRPSLIYGRGRTSLHTRRWPPLTHSSPLGPPLQLSIRRAALPTAVPSIQSWPTLMPTVCDVRSAEASPAPHLHPRREAQDQRTHPPSVLGRPPVTPRTLWAS